MATAVWVRVISIVNKRKNGRQEGSNGDAINECMNE
jgi:hypothetical protein